MDKVQRVRRSLPQRRSANFQIFREQSFERSDQESRRELEEDLCKHIFTVSAGMVGVCLTVIGMVRIVISIRKIDTLADDFIAVNALLFLISCLASYFALRTRNVSRTHRMERFADSMFILAMVVMTCNCLFITYAVSSY